MYSYVRLTKQSGEVAKVFLENLDTGTSAKHMLTVPGVFESEVIKSGDKYSLSLEQLRGSIGTYNAEMFALTIDDEVGNHDEDIDVTEQVARILSMPETAANAFLSQMSSESALSLRHYADTISMYSGITQNTKLCVPRVAMKNMTEDVIDKMVSNRVAYVLRASDNQEVFQKSYDSDYCVQLPSIASIHESENEYNEVLDIMRVIAPYRKVTEDGRQATYYSIYHTPHYKVDLQLNGAVPAHLNWMLGSIPNNTLDIFPNERKMENNLRLLISSDITQYVSEIATGMFLTTPLGHLLHRLCGKRNNDTIDQLLKDIKEKNSEHARCELNMSKVDELKSNGWYIPDVVEAVKSNLFLEAGYLQTLAEERSDDRKLVDCEHIPFVLDLTDAEKQTLTELFIKRGFITSAMQAFLLELCKCAYRVNWGHTGSTFAIPGFSRASSASTEKFNKQMAEYITLQLQGKTPNEKDFPLIYPNVEYQDSDTDNIDDATAEEDISISMNYYISSATARKIIDSSRNGDGYNFFADKSDSMSTEASIVERIKLVNGENNINHFISSAYIQTGDPHVFIEAFIKLMRWGDRKPTALVFQNNPEIRVIFDLNSGEIVNNTAIVNESDLIKVNGCDYSLKGFLCSNSNPQIDSSYVIGFLLEKDYGEVQKKFLMSWFDLASVLNSGENINIAEFVAVTPMQIDKSALIPIESFAKKDYDFFVTDDNIQLGLRLKVAPKDLSALSLLVIPGILRSKEYLMSLKNTSIVTTKDRQYDILGGYVKTLTAFYTKYPEVVGAIKNTVDIGQCAAQIARVFDAIGGLKKEHNEAVSSKTMQTLNFDSDKTEITYDTSELNGVCWILNDDTGSSIPTIKFTDPNLIAASLKGKFILLLMDLGDKFVICRKDVPYKRQNGEKVVSGVQPYSKFEAAVTAIKGGKTPKVNQKPVLLHESVKGLL